MASLFRPHVIHYINAQGRRVRKGTPGAQRLRVRSRQWHGKYRDADGVLKRAPLFRDKAASQARLTELVRRAERLQVGLADPQDEQLTSATA